MTIKHSSGSFDIILGMKEIGGRNNLCLSFGAGLFRKLGWSSGDWIEFDTSQPGSISFKNIPPPDETYFYARKIKLTSGFYKICFYSKQYIFPQHTVFSKEKAIYNIETKVLTLEVPDAYRQSPEEQIQNEIKSLKVEDIAAAFRKL